MITEKRMKEKKKTFWRCVTHLNDRLPGLDPDSYVSKRGKEEKKKRTRMSARTYGALTGKQPVRKPKNISITTVFKRRDVSLHLRPGGERGRERKKREKEVGQEETKESRECTSVRKKGREPSHTFSRPSQG